MAKTNEKKEALIQNEKKYENKTNREIVDELLENNLIFDCVYFQFGKLYKIPGEKWKKQYEQDFLQDLVLILLTYDNDKLNDAYHNKHMNALITRIIQNNIYSKSSKFYNSYLRFDLTTDELDDKY